jgi:replication-associated recombination protein RarA
MSMIRSSCAIAALTFSLSAAGQTSNNSSVEFIRSADLSKSPSHVPGSPHSHVRQSLGYGKGYRYGHSVSGPMGNITIYSAAPNKTHAARMQPRSYSSQRPPTSSSTGFKLKYKPGYGKSTKPGYGQ